MYRPVLMYLSRLQLCPRSHYTICYNQFVNLSLRKQNANQSPGQMTLPFISWLNYQKCFHSKVADLPLTRDALDLCWQMGPEIGQLLFLVGKHVEFDMVIVGGPSFLACWRHWRQDSAKVSLDRLIAKWWSENDDKISAKGKRTPIFGHVRLRGWATKSVCGPSHPAAEHRN